MNKKSSHITKKNSYINDFLYCLIQFLNIHEFILQTQLSHTVMFFFESIRTIKIVLLETREK